MSTDKNEEQAETDSTDSSVDDAGNEATREDADFNELAADEPAAAENPEAPEEPEAADQAQPADDSPRPARSITGIVAIVLSLAALAAVALLFTRQEPQAERDTNFVRPGELDALRGQVDSLSDSFDLLEGTIDGLSSLDDESAAARQRLQDTIAREIRELERQLASYESLPTRVGNLENAVSAIQGLESGARDTLLLAEAEYYLQTANTILAFAGNVELAKTALGMADDRLVSIGNPALSNIRQAISDEVAELDGIPIVDIESNAILLSSLARLADSLPIRTLDGPDQAGSEPESNQEPGAAGRAWSAIKEAVGDVVKVTPPGGEDTPLLIPGSEPLIRSNLSLQLQAARLALLTGEQAIFEQSLDDADAWLVQYFDDSSLQVQSARETLAEVRRVRLEPRLPDISESLRLLRQYESLSGSAP